MRLFQSGALSVRAAGLPAVVLLGAGTGLVALTAVGGVFVVLGATWAVIAVTGTGLVTRLAPAGIRGEALGVHAALMAASGGVGGLLGGWAARFGYLVAFLLAAALVAGGALVVVALRGLSAVEESAPGTAD